MSTIITKILLTPHQDGGTEVFDSHCLGGTIPNYPWNLGRKFVFMKVKNLSSTFLFICFSANGLKIKLCNCLIKHKNLIFHIKNFQLIFLDGIVGGYLFPYSPDFASL